MLKIVGNPKLHTWRTLRYYESIAKKTYSQCSDCDIPIFPGDHYGALVMVYGKYLRVKRFHLGCPVDPDDPNDGEQCNQEVIYKNAA